MGFINIILNISTWWSSLDVNYQTVLISGCISFFILGFGCAISEAIRRRNKSAELTQYKQFIEEADNKTGNENICIDYLEFFLFSWIC